MELLVSIKEATESITKNREVHIADYKEALAVWREDVTTYTKLLEEWAGQEGHLGRPSEPNRPRNYIGEYDKLIAKLGRHKSDTVILTDNEYSTIFEDAFYWQSQFQRQKAPIYMMGNPSSSSFRHGNINASSISTSNITADKINGIGTDSTHVPLEDE